jgi:hypothetical protein
VESARATALNKLAVCRKGFYIYLYFCVGERKNIKIGRGILMEARGTQREGLNEEERGREERVTH